VATTATLTDPPSPDMAVAATDSATGDVMAEGSEAGTMGAAPAPPPRELIAPVFDGRQARVLSVPITSVSDAPPLTTVGTSHQGVAPILAPSEPIASVSDEHQPH